MNTPDTTIDLSAPEFMTSAVSEIRALQMFPALRSFRSTLGHTALIQAPNPFGGATIWAKHEYTNPFGSIKDRTAYAIVCDAVNKWDQSAPLKLIDASGGNMARSLANLGSLMEIEVRIVVPASVPEALVTELTNAGAEVDLADSERFLLGIIEESEQIAHNDHSWTLLSQHRNPANVAMHEFGTGQEIVDQLKGITPTVLVAAIGSGGTLTGLTRALRSRYPDLQVIGVSPAELPYGTTTPPNGDPKFAGAGGLGYGLKQPLVARELPEIPIHTVSYPQALDGMQDYRELTNTAIGASSAANWLTACAVARTLTEDDTVITTFADAGSGSDWTAARKRADHR